MPDQTDAAAEFGGFTAERFAKKFQLNKPEDSEKLTFIIRNLKDNKTQVFEIVNTTHVTEDVVVVNKLK